MLITSSNNRFTLYSPIPSSSRLVCAKNCSFFINWERNSSDGEKGEDEGGGEESDLLFSSRILSTCSPCLD